MIDSILDVANGVNLANLRRFISLAEWQPETTDEAICQLADKEDLAKELRAIGPDGCPDADTLLDSIFNPDAPLESLQNTRRRTREMLDQANGVMQQGCIGLLYQAAIATAFLRHNRNIANRPIETRQAMFGQLAEQLGRGPLAEIFAAASKAQ